MTSTMSIIKIYFFKYFLAAESILEPDVLLFSLKLATAICPFNTLVKIFFILLFLFSNETVLVTSVVPK